jgi:uncharacterized membrane protein YqiK
MIAATTINFAVEKATPEGEFMLGVIVLIAVIGIGLFLFLRKRN